MDHSGRSYSNDQYSFFEKRLLAITAMNTDLPPFKNGEHNSESASTLDRDITPLKGCWYGQKWLHLSVDSEAYHEQIGPIPSSNGSLDIALSDVHT